MTPSQIGVTNQQATSTYSFVHKRSDSFLSDLTIAKHRKMVHCYFHRHWSILLPLGITVLLLPLQLLGTGLVNGFLVPWGTPNRSCYLTRTAPRATAATTTTTIWQNSNDQGESLPSNDDVKNAEGEVGRGRNWIERSFPVDMAPTENPSDQLANIEDYNLGISGISFGTGTLSKRMFDVMLAQNSPKDSSEPLSEEIQSAFILCAMDFTAKEATRAALSQNGLEMSLSQDEEEQGMWGDVDTIQVLSSLEDDNATMDNDTTLYDSIEEAVGHWTPGQAFHFVVRQVPAKIKPLSVEEVLDALDPQGREQLLTALEENQDTENENDRDKDEWQ